MVSDLEFWGLGMRHSCSTSLDCKLFFDSANWGGWQGVKKENVEIRHRVSFL